MRKIVFFIVLLHVFTSMSALAQQRSAKRGICWDESTQPLTDAPVSKMTPGVSWLYNWGAAPVGQASLLGAPSSVAFVPMCWNGGFNETALRAYLADHPETQLLLGFNEPNLTWNVGGAQMTPQQAFDAWPAVLQVAQDYGLQLVAPALNFSGNQVGGRVWSPFEWYDEFFRLFAVAGTDPAIDYLAFHSYMNWYSAVNWVATEYFYTDKESSDLFAPTNKALYPNLVSYLENYKAAHGHFPRMFLTEFCAWEGDKDGYVSTLDNQMDQMTQKVQKLEQSDLVAGYAWFMGNTSQSPAQYPYNSVFLSNTPASELSALGQVYVYMSSFDATKFFAPGETVLAKDYIDASTDAQVARVRPNTDAASDAPLQVEWQPGAWTAYQFDVPADGTYRLTLHISSPTAADFRVYQNALGAANKRLDTTLPSTDGLWADVSADVSLTAGQQRLLLYNMSTATLLVNRLTLSATTSVSNISTAGTDAARYYSLDGRLLDGRPTAAGVYIHHGRKFVIK